MAADDVDLHIIVPGSVAAEVGLRLQQRYPDVIAEATSPADAMRRVVGWWTANLLADSAAQDVQVAAQARISALQAQTNVEVAQARTAAWERIQQVLATQSDMTPPNPAE